MQFHPTVLYIAGSSRTLISEAVRGEGAILIDRNDDRFMSEYDSREELAPRDVVSQAIVSQMEKTRHPCVYLDLSHLDPKFVRNRFPGIGAACAKFGIDITQDRIPVRPGAHYMIGGVTVSDHGQSTLPGLWAALEVTTAELERQSQALAAQQAIADSVQLAATGEYERLREDLDQARSSSAPAAVVDSLRQALIEAQRRTEALEQSLRRAQAELTGQLAQADSMRQTRAAELERLRTEMAAATRNAVSRDLLDSLRQAVQDAEQQVSGIEERMRAVRGVDLASVAQTNQGAVGLVSAFVQGKIYDGSGFAITGSGFFLTNRHVVLVNGRRADSVFVTMADQRRMTRADIVNIAPLNGPDIAVLQIRNYGGPHVPRVDWQGTKARQGEPAALIGFPAGLAAALDRTQTIRTSMAGGIFSQVTPDEIRFDGFTVGGSSGSPILNAAGEVVAIHRAGLVEAAGLAFAVPVRLAIPLLPPAARAEAGIR